LSGGQQQLVGVARAVVASPGLILKRTHRQPPLGSGP
jgi:ABC-type ATPase involved in cell division